MNTVSDNLSSDDIRVCITSGSFGEGLQMIGSDLDIMYVIKSVEVHDNITSIVFNSTTSYFTVFTEDTKLGYVMLRLISSPLAIMREICEQFREDNYLSSTLFKNTFLDENTPVVHGPCLSDRKELLIDRTCFIIPPVAYAHFLSFLCYYHLNNVRECQISFQDLNLTIADKYFIGIEKTPKSVAYYCLGTALQLIGDNISAKLVFSVIVKLCPIASIIRQFKRLYLKAPL
ncbi:unnamed protein product [Mytilus edulis]|uniref:Uncharacterized protein n=1 Tax=Mytilus edulis TaxID=6550 RepID=A0A8S3QKL2_MYTED|nr:unnamed protein product [Mytilus edulis]